jgi:hypothetical protein
MKELKTYAHLYMGCEVNILHRVLDDTEETFVERGKLVGITESEVERGKLIAIIDMNCESLQECYIEDVKLILRPLSDMSEEEARHIYRSYFGKSTAEDWSGDTGSAYFRPKQITPNKTHGLRIVEGEDYSSGDFMTVVGLMPYLLSRGFDLFGLIDSGLAVSKTETK